MATDIRSFSDAIPDTASLRTFIQTVQASLAAAGAVKTADTGQIDSSTVVWQATTGFLYGYEIYRFSDALQATRPVFIKVEYASAASTGHAVIWTTVGFATNGAGTLTGQVSTRTQSYAGSAGGSSGNLYSSCGPDRFCFAANTFIPHIFMVGRAKDEAGADTAEGVIILQNSANTSYVQSVPFLDVGVVGAQRGAIAAFGGIGNMSGQSATPTDVAIGLVTCPFNGKWRYLIALLYGTNDIAALSTFTTTLLGSSRVFLALGSGFLAWGVDNNTRLAVPWE